MTSRVALPPKDIQKMCKQAERDHESKKLIVLMDRVRRQIAERERSEQTSHHSSTASGDSGLHRVPDRSLPLER